MKTIILKTKPYSMFRLGSGSLEETDKIIHSDTLFSAIVNIHSKVFEDTENFVELFEHGSIKISSAFPMLMNNEKKIYFLPKPELDYSVDENIKEEKKIKFISKDVFNSLINKNLTNVNLLNENTLIGASFVVTGQEINDENEIGSFIREIVTAKTKVHYEEQKDNFYHETDIQLLPLELKEEILFPHFYFMYEVKCEPEQEKEFITCVRILADEGIGGERSTGKGQFEKIIETEIDLNSNNSSSQNLLLSLLNPKTNDEFDACDNYEILIRGGGSVSFDTDDESVEEEIKPYRKKQVRMIAEGAIITKNVEGHLVDVTPDKGAEHKYFRNGKSFTIPLG